MIQRRNRRSLWVGICLALLSGCQDDSGRLVVSGRVEVDDVHVGSKIGGRVSQVNFDEGEVVELGAVIVSLEDQEIVAEIEQAKAILSEESAGLDLLLAGTRAEDIRRSEAVVQARTAELDLRKKGFREEEILQADAEVESARSDLALASAEFKRTAALFQERAVDERELDNKRAALETAEAKMEIAHQRQSLYHTGSRPEEIAMAEAQLAEAQSDLDRLENGPRPEEIAAQRASVDAAKANIVRLETQMEETRIKAPCDAVVETLDLEPGDLVQAGETVAVLNLKNSPWVRCYIPENRLGSVRVGDPVSIVVDSFPDEEFPGKIRRISSDAEFTPRNVQTTEKRSELVFEMKVDVLEGGERLRAGMYADIHIHGGLP